MSKKIQLSIAEPCHENWDNMTQADKGRFCGSCQKTVVDFSTMSDRQVAEFFKKPSTGSVCGRFMADQLDRTMEIPKKRIPWLRYFFQITIPAFLFSMKASAQKKSQGTEKSAVADTARVPVDVPTITLGLVAPREFDVFKKDTAVTDAVRKADIGKNTDDTSGVVECSKLVGKVDMSYNRIQGKVIDENGNPVAFATIDAGGSKKSMMADENGNFFMPVTWLDNNSVVQFSAADHESVKITKGTVSYSDGKLVIVLQSKGNLTGVTVTTYGVQGSIKVVMGAVSTVRAKDIETIPKIETMPAYQNEIVLFPNPVQPGATLHLSLKRVDEGYHAIDIMAADGKSVYKKQLWIDAGARVMNIELPILPGGNYFLSIINQNTGKVSTEKMVIR